jgi:hypothetical protein
MPALLHHRSVGGRRYSHGPLVGAGMATALEDPLRHRARTIQAVGVGRLVCSATKRYPARMDSVDTTDLANPARLGWQCNNFKYCRASNDCMRRSGG